MDASPCRCGHPKDSPDPHPCHGLGHTCRKPAKQYFYSPYPKGHPGASLAGMQMKACVSDTWACESCWAAFKALLDAARK